MPYGIQIIFSRFRYSFSTCSISSFVRWEFLPSLKRHSPVTIRVPSPSTWMEPPSRIKSSRRYLSLRSMSQTFLATWSSLSHGKYSPSTSPPQALKDQSTPLTSDPLVTKVGPQSRIQESSVDISTTRTSSGSWDLALSYWALLTHTVTGSNWLMAFATSTNTFWAGLAPSLQLSGRSGQIIQQPSCGSNSPGILKPSCFEVVVYVFM